MNMFHVVAKTGTDKTWRKKKEKILAMNIDT